MKQGLDEYKVKVLELSFREPEAEKNSDNSNEDIVLLVALSIQANDFEELAGLWDTNGSLNLNRERQAVRAKRFVRALAAVLNVRGELIKEANKGREVLLTPDGEAMGYFLLQACSMAIGNKFDVDPLNVASEDKTIRLAEALLNAAMSVAHSSGLSAERCADDLLSTVEDKDPVKAAMTAVTLEIAAANILDKISGNGSSDVLDEVERFLDGDE